MASPAVETRQTSTDTTQPKPHFNDKDWYQESVETIPEDERELLEQYSGLKPEEVIPHVVALVSRSVPFEGWESYVVSNIPKARQSISNQRLYMHRTITLPVLSLATPPLL